MTIFLRALGMVLQTWEHGLAGLESFHQMLRMKEGRHTGSTFECQAQILVDDAQNTCLGDSSLAVDCSNSQSSVCIQDCLHSLHIGRTPSCFPSGPSLQVHNAGMTLGKCLMPCLCPWPGQEVSISKHDMQGSPCLGMGPTLASHKSGC